MAAQPRIPCKFFPQRRCKKGESCTFSHDQELPSMSTGVLGLATTASSNLRADNVNLNSVISAPRMNIAGWPPSPAVAFNGGAGIFVPCKFFQKGNCFEGSTCRFAHVLQTISQPQETLLAGRGDLTEKTTAAENEDLEINKIELESTSETETRIMGGSLSVTFGPGLIISAIRNAVSSPMITIRNLTSSTSAKDVVSLLSPFKGDIDSNAIRIVKTAETVYATVNLDNLVVANKVVKALDGSGYEKNSLSVKPLQTKDLVTSASQEATRINCSWFAPAMTAYAYFGNYADAEAAVGEGKRAIRGRLVECELQSPRIRQTKYSSVWLGGLNPMTTAEDIKQILGCDNVTIGKRSYTISEEEAATRVQSLFTQNKQIDGFEIISGPNDRKTRAIIQFKTAEDARTSFKEFNGKRQTFLGNSPLNLDLIFSTKFKVLADIYLAVANELDKISQKGEKEGYVKVKAFGDGSSLVTIRVYGPHRISVVSTKTAVQSVVRGEICCDDEGGILWDPFLTTTEGAILVKDTILSTRAYIYGDTRKRQISLYGSPTARAEARVKLIAEISRIKSRIQEIPLGALSVGKAMRGGLKSKIRQLGCHRFFIDVTRRSLIFQGTAAEAVPIKNCLSEILKRCGKGENPKINEEDQCNTCRSELEDPKAAPCGHQYCRICLQNYLTSAITARKFPVKCHGNNSNCTEYPIPFIKEVQSKADMDSLFEAAFDAYIRLHKKNYQYCPTPDCCYVYSTTETGEIVTCSECFVGICTACNVEAHDGQTCAENRSLVPEEETRLFEDWKKIAGVKPCPKCGVDIEKDGGCNHMVCKGCEAHICWFCMGLFLHEEIYGHMAEKHGGMGLERGWY